MRSSVNFFLCKWWTARSLWVGQRVQRSQFKCLGCICCESPTSVQPGQKWDILIILPTSQPPLLTTIASNSNTFIIWSFWTSITTILFNYRFYQGSDCSHFGLLVISCDAWLYDDYISLDWWRVETSVRCVWILLFFTSTQSIHYIGLNSFSGERFQHVIQVQYHYIR